MRIIDVVSVVFGIAGFSSGVYFYLQSGEQAKNYQAELIMLQGNYNDEASRERGDTSNRLKNLMLDNEELKYKLETVNRDNEAFSREVIEFGDRFSLVETQLNNEKHDRIKAQNQRDDLVEKLEKHESLNSISSEYTIETCGLMNTKLEASQESSTELAIRLIEFTKQECTRDNFELIRQVLLDNLAFFDVNKIRLALNILPSPPPNIQVK